VETKALSRSFGGLKAVDAVDFRLEKGEIRAIIGPNGAGKTTLFKMITGQESPDKGTVRIGETVKLGYVDQSRDTLDPDKTVWEEISGGAEVVKLGQRLGVPFDKTWSCYANNDRPCGRCRPCTTRAAGFLQAGLPDPLLLEPAQA